MDDEQLLKAIQLARSGDRETARSILVQLVRGDPHNEKAWVWLIEVLPLEQKRRAVELFNQANPGSSLARKAQETISRQPAGPVNANAPEPSSYPEEPAFISAVQQPARDFPQDVPIPQEVVSMPETDAELSEILAHPDTGHLLPPVASVVPEDGSIGKPVDIKVRQTKQIHLQSGASSNRKWDFTVAGIMLLAVIMVVILVGLMASEGLFRNIPNPLLAFARPTVVLATPSFTSTPKPATPTKTVTPTPSNTLTATPPPPTETPSPTAYLATPVNAKAIVPENADRLGFFYQSALPEKVLVSPSLHLMLILDGSSQVHPMDFNTTRRIFIANLPSDSTAVAAFSPDESSIAVGITHGNVLVYAIPSGKVLNTLSASSIMLEYNSSLAFSSDGNSLIASAGNGYIVWDLKTSAIIGQGSLPDGPIIAGLPAHGPVVLVGQTFYAPCGSAICATDITTRKEIQHYPASDGDLVSRFALSPAGDRIAVQTSGKDNLFTITVYKIEDGTVVGKMATTFTALWEFAYTPDGRLLAAWGQQSTNGRDGLIFMDTEQFSQVSSLEIGKVAQPGVGAYFTQGLWFSPDGGILAVQSPYALRIYSVY